MNQVNAAKTKFVSVLRHFAPIDKTRYDLQVNRDLTELQAQDAKRKFEDAMYLEGQEVAKKQRLVDATTSIEKDVGMTDEEIISLEIDLIFDPNVETAKFLNLLQPNRPHTRRPKNWRVIVEEYKLGSELSTLQKNYPEMTIDCTGQLCYPETIRSRLRRWIREYEFEKKHGIVDNHEKGGMAPAYGKAIDMLLLEEVKKRIALALPVDAIALREMLLPILKEQNKMSLCRSAGGSCDFGVPWAQRFFKRHDLRSRVVTTKYRETPADFEKKEKEFLDVLSDTLAQYNVPDKLVVAMDETGQQLVPSSAKTRAAKGAKKIRLQGMEKNKAQITVSITVVETGEMLPPQLIWKGKTPRCHSPAPVPFQGYHDHSDTHWQTPESFVRYVRNILVPYRLKMIRESNYRVDQKMILILDLHYSHKDAASLQAMQEHNIIPVFIPGSCTDVMQVLDVCCNRPFKVAVRGAFRDYIHLAFKRHTDAKLEASSFRVPLSMTDLKPVIPGFLSKGFESLTTAEMKKTIKQCFIDAGRVGKARSMAEEKKELPNLVIRLVIPAETEPDEHHYDSSDDEDDVSDEEEDL